MHGLSQHALAHRTSGRWLTWIVGRRWSSAAGPRVPRPGTGWRARVTGCSSSRRSAFPARRRCGDGLTPRAVRQLEDMGLGPQLSRIAPLRRPALDRPRRDPRAGVAGAPRLPRLRLRRPPPRPRPHGRRRRRRAPAPRSGRAPRRSPRSSRTASSRGAVLRQRDGQSRSRCGPATWWSPTARTRASGARSAPRATAPTRWAWRCGATSPARTTTSRGSRATSTCATATATTCPGTAGSSRWATAP